MNMEEFIDYLACVNCPTKFLSLWIKAYEQGKELAVTDTKPVNGVLYAKFNNEYYVAI